MSGGDRRIRVRPGDNTNIYGASPFPRSTLGYASSTANDISAAAFRHLESTVGGWPAGLKLDAASYANMLEGMRRRIRSVWNLHDETDVVFAPSGTDLEYVALSLAEARAGAAIGNILLGTDEVGSGCVQSAAGRYFAAETAVAARVPQGGPVAGFGGIERVDVPIRGADGTPLASGAIADAIEEAADLQRAHGRAALVHIVYGSKTGLVVPDAADLARLVGRAQPDTAFVVDACQARIDAGNLRQLLALGCIVMLTGSKFVGGPPFSGFALVPPAFRPQAALPQGLASIFRRAEWPLQWSGCDHLASTVNPGLLLRMEAALFEMERFGSVGTADRTRIIGAFGDAVRTLARRLGVGLVAPCLQDTSLHRGTLATLDLSGLPAAPDMALAQRWHRVLAARGVRLGQPVKCVRKADGGWAATLRLSLSMPLIVELAALSADDLRPRLARDMGRIAQVLEAAQKPLAA